MRRHAVAVALTAAMVLATGAVTGAATAAPAYAIGKATDVDADAASAYQRSFEMTANAARAAVAGESSRHALYSALAAQPAFGGAWFDPPTGVVHVAVTTEKAGRAAVTLGTRLGVRVRTHRVARSFDELQAQAERIRTGNDALSQAAQDNVGIDVRANRVVVSLPATSRLTAAMLPEGVSVSAEAPQQGEDDTCTNRADCNDTIMAGTWLSPRCSTGFTARGNGGRYVLTAGHCTTGNGVAWGVGGTTFGTMENSRNSGGVDVSIIRVDQAPYTTQGGGYIFCAGCSGSFFPIVGVLRDIKTVALNERVCLSANVQDAAGVNFCGTVRSSSDSSHRGMISVNNLDACPGESGGGWYWPADQGRFAYGIHSGSDTGCRISGGHSWFTALPTIGSSFGFSLNVETR
jgi:streptogrisin C